VQHAAMSRRANLGLESADGANSAVVTGSGSAAGRQVPFLVFVSLGGGAAAQADGHSPHAHPHHGTGARAPTASSTSKARDSGAAADVPEDAANPIPAAAAAYAAAPTATSTTAHLNAHTGAASALAGGAIASAAQASLKPGDGVLIAESRSHPGARVIFRTREAREANPERLDLDRRGLDQCCLLAGIDPPDHSARFCPAPLLAAARRYEATTHLVSLQATTAAPVYDAPT